MAKRCVFTTANERYVPFALTSLISFLQVNPGFDAYILSNSLGDKTRQLCASVGVQSLELPLAARFHREWAYPRECYYHFAGPDLFSILGYEVSVYIDGDTYSNAGLSQAVLRPRAIAGHGYDTVAGFFAEIGDLDLLRSAFGLSEAGLNRTRVQSGVLVYNNRALREIDYLQLTIDLFDAAIAINSPRKGDDSLLALTLAKHPAVETTILPMYYNMMDYKVVETLGWAVDAMLRERCVVYHFVEHKPWFGWDGRFASAHHRFRDQWVAIMKSHLPEKVWRGALEPFMLQQSDNANRPSRGQDSC